MILDVNERGHSIARVAVVNLHLRSGSKQVANDCLRASYCTASYKAADVPVVVSTGNRNTNPYCVHQLTGLKRPIALYSYGAKPMAVAFVNS